MHHVRLTKIAEQSLGLGQSLVLIRLCSCVFSRHECRATDNRKLVLVIVVVVLVVVVVVVVVVVIRIVFAFHTCTSKLCGNMSVMRIQSAAFGS